GDGLGGRLRGRGCADRDPALVPRPRPRVGGDARPADPQPAGRLSGRGVGAAVAALVPVRRPFVVARPGPLPPRRRRPEPPGPRPGTRHMSFTLFGLGTALPSATLTQDEGVALARVLGGPDLREAPWLPAVYAHSGIKARHQAIDRAVIDDVLRGTRTSGSVFLPTGEPGDPG